jgi:hypothetical protein
MPRLTSFVAAFVAAFAISTVALGAAELSPQTSSESMVMITVTPHPGGAGKWEFEVTLNTHSGALNDDLVKSAVLVTADGKQFAPTAWRGDGPGGHHRKGVLSFESTEPSTSAVELRIQRPGETAARSFRWALN